MHHARLGCGVDGGEGHGEEGAGARHSDNDALAPLPLPAARRHGLARQADAVQHRAQIDVQGEAPGVVACGKQVAWREEGGEVNSRTTGGTGKA